MLKTNTTPACRLILENLGWPHQRLALALTQTLLKIIFSIQDS